MAVELKAGVRRRIDRLRKDLAAAAERVAALRDEINRHQLVYDMLDGRKTARPSWRGQLRTGPLTRGPRGAMIDWKAVFEILPDQFTLDTMSAHEAVGDKPRVYLRQVVVRWSKEGRIKRTGRGAYQKI